jgi:diguanylate cyclase (GGDEF)-like protein/PAS domain S-box-containing protein
MSLKNRTFIFVFFILLLFSAAFLAINSLQQKEQLSKIKSANNEHVRTLYEKVSSLHQDFYEHRILANINSVGVKEAFAKGDREALYNLTYGRFQALQQENKYLVIMQFHQSDSKIFLRMHDKDRYGDFISNSRSMAREMHLKKTPIFGFEESDSKLLYRMMYPIFLDNVYLGAIEFGFSAEFMLKNLEEIYSLSSILYVKDKEHEGKSAYTLVANFVYDADLLAKISKTTPFDPLTQINTEIGNSYCANVFDIYDYNKELIAKVVVFLDITQEVTAFVKDRNYLIVLVIGIVISMMILINIVFNKTIRLLEKEYDVVREYKKMIDENVITASLDLNCRIIDVSEAFLATSGYKKIDLLKQRYRYLFYHDTPKELPERIARSLQSTKVYYGEIKKNKRDGSYFWVTVNIQPRYKEDKHVGYDVIMHDITDKKQNDQLMVRDGLTGVYNRRHFNDIFPRMIQTVKRDGGYLSFLILDIDFFKAYNDTYGHQAGDGALISVAKSLQKSLHRGDDYCFRLGGEEFAVLYKSSNPHEAYLFAQKIRKNIMSLNIVHENNGDEGILTASFGLITLKDEELTNDDDIYKRGDAYLYEAKLQGRNRVVSKVL